MPLTVSPKFGVYTYSGTDPQKLDWGMPASAIVGRALRGDAGRALPGTLEPRKFTIRGIAGNNATITTADLLRDTRDAFNWAHRPGLRKLYRDSDRYWRNVQVANVSLPEDTGLLYLPYSVDLVASDPFQYAETADTYSWAAASGATQVFANDGDATAFPEITIYPSSAATLAFDLYNDTLLPAAPTLVAAGTGGYLAAGTYWVKLAWLFREGETNVGTVASQATTGTTSKITVTAPSAPEDALGYYVYAGLGAGEPADSAKYRQHTFGPIPIGRNFVLRTLLTSGEVASTPSFGALRLDGAVAASDALFVDNLEQVVYLNQAFAMSYLSSPFFPFLPGNNTLRVVYSGATIGSIDFSWRKRWL